MSDKMNEIDGLAKIKVIGIGGGGVNAINHMIDEGIQDVNFIAMNTDAQHLSKSSAETKIILGEKLTQGLGAGANPEIGREAAEESVLEIEEALEGADMVILAAGEGGGTGTGASPIVAKAARAKGILTVAVVTRPFDFEQKRKALQAEEGIERLRAEVDALIIIPNERLLVHLDNTTSLIEAFNMANRILYDAVSGITDIITSTDFISVDFADVSAVLKDSGTALMGLGVARGDNRAVRAAELATSSPLLDTTIEGAKAVLVRIQASDEFGLHELAEAAKLVTDNADSDVNVITGIRIDNDLGDEVKITIIAAGFNGDSTEASFADHYGRISFAKTTPSAAAATIPDSGSGVSAEEAKTSAEESSVAPKLPDLNIIETLPEVQPLDIDLNNGLDVLEIPDYLK